MYSDLKNVQIIVALLKKYEIKDIVISAGTRHTPFVYSVEHDSFFKCYSIVDERSASFFALGLIQAQKKPVVISCTSGTAACNYVSAVNEAFFQQLPLVVITADRNPYYLYQQEEQMVPQLNLYKDVCKKKVNLPIVRDEKDFWYCSRLVNEALLELNHRVQGPVHINFPVENNYPIYQGIVKFNTDELPSITKISRLLLEDGEEAWKSKAKELCSYSKIMIIYGQHGPITKKEKAIIERFVQKYNCIVSVDHLSNLTCSKSIPTFLCCKMINPAYFLRLCPDIVITMNGSTISEIKTKLLYFTGKYKHWHVSEEGMISDPFQCQTDIIECKPITFFKKFGDYADTEEENSYFKMWYKQMEPLEKNGGLYNADLKYSSIYAVQQFMKKIPTNSLFHIANSNSVRITNYFVLDESIDVYCNRGTNGIDGSMSAFIGQAYITQRLSFLLIGDLSFFYDMNALWNRYIGNNIRILVCNNSGGAIFHNYPNTSNVPTLDEHIAAAHQTSVESWVKSRGFNYISAKNKEEFNKKLNLLMVEKSDKPILLEVFTNKDIDVKEMNSILDNYKSKGNKLTKKMTTYMPEKMIKKIKKILKK
ncbi:MAG: 2-succinyl-5-enolpyruvyl-6-hydroxy-3-cyclohexene-1-carboxylic-acid synthase [Eubacterium callanderi]|uniref:2-succinyl-5-enolpyruvyl-6-hydroxy-3- cyclohexene-1-carboxylic-acid synthase n=1 Tax=Eubacterium callanderi TaxID=53442 RepID=UPI0039960E0A